MDIITYALSKKIAAHAVSGVQSMSVSGQTLTINTKDSGVLTMTFPTPKDGVSVTDIDVNANNQIVFTMSDGTDFISGKIPTVKGDKGDPGFSPTITENAGNTDKIYKLDITTVDSTFTTPNLKGADGQGGSGGGEENTIEFISVNGTPISPDENKNVDITVPSIEGLTKDADLATVAKSGSYNDLADKPTIPSLDGYAKTSEIPKKVSQLENDSNYLSSIPEEYVTETELSAKGYLTEHQDISGKVDKVEGKSLISDTEIARLATVNNYDDTDIKAEIAKKADATAIPSKVSELTNDNNYQTAEQVNSTVTTEIAKIVADAPEDLNTLKEMSDWIAGHENDASAMNSAISDNKTAITALQTGKADKSEIPTTVAELADSADYAKKTDVNNSISALQTGKADASDLTAHTDDTDIHVTTENKTLWNTVEDKVNKTSIATVLDDTVTDEQVASALLAKTELDKKIDKTSIVTELSDASTDDEVVGALTTYNELQKLESANKEQFGIARGEAISVNDSVDGKIRDLKLYGKSEQKQYSGKNLLPKLPIAKKTLKGVDITINEDGSIVLNGTSTEEIYHVIDVSTTLPSGTYKFSGGTNQNKDVYIMSSIGNYMHSSSNLTLTADNEWTISQIAIYVASGITCNNEVIYPQLEVGSVVTDFEPYTGGIPSPNPDYPQEIKSVINPVVRTCGKNLLNPTLETTTQNGVTCTNNGDGTYTLNGTANDNCAFKLCSGVLKEGNYRIVGTPFLRNTSVCWRVISNGKYNELYSDRNYLNFTQTNTSSFNAEIKVFNGATFNNAVLKPMLTTDLTATYDDYVPYQEEQTATLPYTLNAIPVESGGNVTIDGQQYIADYVDFEKKQLVRMVGEKVLNGTEIWGKYLKAFYTTLTGYKKADTKNTICDSYISVRNVNGGVMMSDERDNNTICLYLLDDADRIYLRDDSCSTAEELKSKLAANNSEIYYQLATPTIIDLTDEEAQAFKELATYYPTTNVFVTSEQLNGYAECKYPTTDVSGIASKNEAKIAELTKDVDDKLNEVKVLGWSVPRECPIQNEVSGNQFIQKVGRVDLGTPEYGQSMAAETIYVIIPNIKNLSNESIIPNIFCDGYETIAWNGQWSEKSISMRSDIHFINQVHFSNSNNESSVSAFKSEMQGKYLYYELATPITTTIDGNEVVEELSSNLSQLEFGEVASGKNLLNHNIIDSKIKNCSVLFKNDTFYVTNKGSYSYFILSVPTIVGKSYTVTIKDWSDYSYRCIASVSDLSDNTLASIVITDATLSMTFTAVGTESLIHINPNNTQNEMFNTITFKCMLEEGSVATEYEPYIPSVKMLAEDVSAQNESLSVIGKCKNLLNPTLQTTTQDGVTCTNNGDGTYTLNGTATANAYFTLEFISKFEDKIYKIVSFKNATSKIYSYINAQALDGATINSILTEIDIPTGYISKNKYKSFDMGIAVKSGTTLTNEIVKPMLTTNLSATYDDFVPYTGEGDTLTHDVAEIKNDLGSLTFSASGTTLSITDGTNTWTLEANS